LPADSGRVLLVEHLAKQIEELLALSSSLVDVDLLELVEEHVEPLIAGHHENRYETVGKPLGPPSLPAVVAHRPPVRPPPRPQRLDRGTVRQESLDEIIVETCGRDS